MALQFHITANKCAGLGTEYNTKDAIINKVLYDLRIKYLESKEENYIIAAVLAEGRRMMNTPPVFDDPPKIRDTVLHSVYSTNFETE